MRQWIILMAVLFSALFSWWGLTQPTEATRFHLHTLEKPTSTVHFVTIAPGAPFKVTPVVSDRLALLPKIVSGMSKPVYAAINAGFFDPANHETTSYVYAKGKVKADPTQNERLMKNPDLQPYLQAMLTQRSEFRLIECADGRRQYAIARHADPLPKGCGLLESLQAGPNLFDPESFKAEAFIAEDASGRRIRDPIGVDRLNARSAVGIREDGSVIFAMAAMKPWKDKPSGLTLKEMAAVMKELGAVQALSLDGGSSATIWAGGKAVYGKTDRAGKIVKRPIKSALVVMQED